MRSPDFLDSKKSTVKDTAVQLAFDTEMCEVPEDEESIHETTAWNAQSMSYENEQEASKHGMLNTSQVIK